MIYDCLAYQRGCVISVPGDLQTSLGQGLEQLDLTLKLSQQAVGLVHLESSFQN